MPQEVTLDFEQEDHGLNLTGTVNFPNALNINGITSLHVRGLGEWRHVPSNILHLNEAAIQNLRVIDRGKNLSKVGVNWIGLKARSDILIGAATRQGRNGSKKVQELLTKFFRTLGASSIRFSLVNPEVDDGDGTDD